MTTLAFLSGMFFGVCLLAIALTIGVDFMRAARLRTADREHGRKMARAIAGSVKTPVLGRVVRIDEARGLRGRKIA